METGSTTGISDTPSATRAARGRLRANAGSLHGVAASASVVLVSVYLGAVMLLLIASRRISAPGFLRTVRAGLRRPYRATVHEVRHERGHCYTTEVPAWLLSDADCGSRLVLLEDDVPLPHPHAAHDDIRSLGGGRFSHWEAAVYFSTPDNSDPRGNGRSYRLVEQR